MSQAKPHYETKRVDHLGIAAGICHEIGLIAEIDTAVGTTGRQVSVGQAIQAMILNGLGFTSRAMYLTPEFFQNRPVAALLGEGVTAEMLTDDSLGDALDRVYEYGVTELFAQVASRGCHTYGIRHRYYHADTSSFHLHGQYRDQPGEPEVIEIRHGYSKEQRPDLKQVMLSLITTHQSAIPTWLEPLSGNSQDKETLARTVQAYHQQLRAKQEESYYVVDSALYSKDNINALNHVWWLTRVPLTIKQAQELLLAETATEMPAFAEEGYRGCVYEVTYGQVPQRWLVVYSAQAAAREAKTFRRRREKAGQQMEKKLRKLAGQQFACEADAQAALQQFADKLKYHQLQATITPVMGYAAPGRPRKDSQPQVQGYQIEAKLVQDKQVQAQHERKRGKFIIATNQMDPFRLATAEMLSVYKAQGVTVERGFRFLRDPMFFADSLFLHKPQRIMALLMVMGLALLVYALAERKLRRQLKAKRQTIPDQKGRPTQTPTMRRVFQMFEGIDLLIISIANRVVRRQVLNLRPVHHQILELLGEPVKNIYLGFQ